MISPLEYTPSYLETIVSWYPFLITILSAVLASAFTAGGLTEITSYKITKILNDNIVEYKTMKDNDETTIAVRLYGLSPFQPPSFVFGITWSIIYITYGYAWFTYAPNLLMDTSDCSLYTNGLFASNMILNVLWCYFYFGGLDSNLTYVYSTGNADFSSVSKVNDIFPVKLTPVLTNIKWVLSLATIVALLLLTKFKAYTFSTDFSCVPTGTLMYSFEEFNFQYEAIGLYIYSAWLVLATSLNLTTYPKNVYTTSDTL